MPVPVSAPTPVAAHAFSRSRRLITIDCYSNRIVMTNLSDELAWRGLVYHATEGLAEMFARDRVTAYIGFDPTAPSLHVGSLLQIMLLARLQRFGHAPIAIVGGGTGMIGDPSGKGQERLLLSDEQIELNLTGIRRQLERFLEFGPGASGS